MSLSRGQCPHPVWSTPPPLWQWGQCPHPVWSTPPPLWQWGQCPHPVWSTPPSPLAVGSMPSPCVVDTPLPSGSGINALTLCGPHPPPLWQWGQCPHPVWSTHPSPLAVGSMPSPCVVHTPLPSGSGVNALTLCGPHPLPLNFHILYTING